MKTKQVILMRTDLLNTKGEPVNTGKLIAQGAHASMASLLVHNRIVQMDVGGDKPAKILLKRLDEAEVEWLENSFTKICLAVNSKEELLELLKQAEDIGLAFAEINDNGDTEFGGKVTTTCGAIGPSPVEDIDKITRHLRLFR